MIKVIKFLFKFLKREHVYIQIYFIHIKFFIILETDPPSLAECRGALEAVRIVVAALVDFVRQHGGGSISGSNRKSAAQDNGSGGGPGGSSNSGLATSKYKVSMCRDLALRGTCPRSNNCTFAHSDTELDK